MALGYAVFLCNELPGVDLAEAIFDAFDTATVVIVMGSKTYSDETTLAAIDTYPEMKSIVQNKMKTSSSSKCVRSSNCS